MKKLTGFKRLVTLGIILLLVTGMGMPSVATSTKVENVLSEKSAQELLTQDEQQWLKKQGKLIYVSDQNSPPMRFVDPADGQYKGAVIDYLNSLSLELGINIETHPMVWKDALNSLSDGKADLCDMFTSVERSRHYLFSDPIYTMRAVLVVKASDNKVLNGGTLNGQWIATQKGDYVNEFISNTYPNIKVHQVDDISQAFKLLKAGKVTAVAGDEPVITDIIRKQSLQNYYRVVEKPLYEREIVFGITKSKPQLVGIINKGIRALDEKKQLDRIQQKWFGISGAISPNGDAEKLRKIAQTTVVVLSMFISAMTIWTYTLRDKVANRTKELHESKEQLQTVFDGLTEYLVVVGANKTLININKAFCDGFNLEKEAAIGSACVDLLKSFCGDCSKCPLNSEEPESAIVEKEAVVGNAVFAVRSYPLKSLEGEYKNLLMVLQDVTADRISKNQMLQTNKMVAVGQLAAGIAHEIRNPLGIIRSHSYILRSVESGAPALEKSLNFIDVAVERASRIIDNLLNFSRISDSAIYAIQIKQFLQNLLELETKHLQKRGIDFDLLCDDFEARVNGESLKHILINLISNAIDAMDNHGQLTIEAAALDNQLVIRVTDTGMGIPEGQLEKIFNPFYTTKAPGSGTGLGLYIVYSEVEKMNGQIEVQSQLGRGTSFQITLPQNQET